MITKEELLQTFVAKAVRKNKLISVAGQTFIEYENKLDNSNQIFKGYETYIGDIEIKNDRLDKVCGDNIKNICTEKGEVFKNKSINRFIQIVNRNRRELQSNKYLLWKKF